MRRPLTYAEAGVDIAAGDETTRRIAQLVASTRIPGVEGFGGFGSVFSLAPHGYGLRIVASTDGVGTKLAVASRFGIYDTVGACLVNHCVNDILTTGATPQLFMDYVASGNLEPDMIAQIISGICRAAHATGVAVIGGETAEMPGTYVEGQFDLVGTIIGLVFDEDEAITGQTIRPGDVLVGVASHGLGTNGYTLVRRIIFDELNLDADTVLPWGVTVKGELLREHESFLPAFDELRERGVNIKGLAHITGTGIPGNLPRILPGGCAARIDRGTWPIPPIFTFLASEGPVEADEMFRVFNMGIQMIVVVSPEEAGDALSIINEVTEGWEIGTVTPHETPEAQIIIA